MTDIKAEVKSLLSNRKGRANAITRRELKQRLNIENRYDRRLRLLIGELRHEGLPILFATDKPAGYYLPESYLELKQGIEAMRSYVIDECRVLRDLKHLGNQYLAKDVQVKLI